MRAILLVDKVKKSAMLDGVGWGLVDGVKKSAMLDGDVMERCPNKGNCQSKWRHRKWWKTGSEVLKEKPAKRCGRRMRNTGGEFLSFFF